VILLGSLRTAWSCASKTVESSGKRRRRPRSSDEPPARPRQPRHRRRRSNRHRCGRVYRRVHQRRVVRGRCRRRLWTTASLEASHCLALTDQAQRRHLLSTTPADCNRQRSLTGLSRAVQMGRQQRRHRQQQQLPLRAGLVRSAPRLRARFATRYVRRVHPPFLACVAVSRCAAGRAALQPLIAAVWPGAVRFRPKETESRGRQCSKLVRRSAAWRGSNCRPWTFDQPRRTGAKRRALNFGEAACRAA
jgi:hypothetical protein